MDQRDIDAVVRRALDEDLPDITSEAIFAPADRGRARFLVKAEGVIAGLAFARATFQALEPAAVQQHERAPAAEAAQRRGLPGQRRRTDGVRELQEGPRRRG